MRLTLAVDEEDEEEEDDDEDDDVGDGFSSPLKFVSPTVTKYDQSASVVALFGMLRAGDEISS